MKLFSILAVFSVIFCACGKDSSTAGSGQASAQSTYADQCTYRKKVTNRATNLTNDEVFYERSISWGPDLTNTFTDYENKSYSTNSSGTIQPGTKIYYGKGRNKLVHLNETDYEITDIFYDTDSSFNQNGTTPSVSVRVWRKDSSSQRTLTSNRSDGAYKALDMVKNITDIDDSTQLITYSYPNPDQVSSDTQKVLEYSRSCIETYQAGRVE